MTTDQMYKFTDLVASLATESGTHGTGAAPFTVQFGYVSNGNICQHDGVRLVDASGFVTRTVVEWAIVNGVSAAVHNGALLIV